MMSLHFEVQLHNSIKASTSVSATCNAVWCHIQVENEDLVFTLETMVEKFGDEIAPYAVSKQKQLRTSPACLCGYAGQMVA